METLGCTTPYGAIKDNICTIPEKGLIALNKSLDPNFFEKCEYPCKFLKIKVIENGKLVMPGPSMLNLRFLKYIRVTTSYLSYTPLEMFGEFGGYVGLFLGISIFHLKDLVNLVIKMHDK